MVTQVNLPPSLYLLLALQVYEVSYSVSQMQYKDIYLGIGLTCCEPILFCILTPSWGFWKHRAGVAKGFMHTAGKQQGLCSNWGFSDAYTLIHSLTLSSCIPARREPEYPTFWCLYPVSLLDHFQGLEFSDSIVRSEPSWSFLPPAITFCIFLSHWLAIFFHISASYFFMYLFLCCYLSLLTGYLSS